MPPNVPTGRGLELAACVAPTDGGHHHVVSDVQKYLTVALGAHVGALGCPGTRLGNHSSRRPEDKGEVFSLYLILLK